MSIFNEINDVSEYEKINQKRIKNTYMNFIQDVTNLITKSWEEAINNPNITSNFFLEFPEIIKELDLHEYLEKKTISFSVEDDRGLPSLFFDAKYDFTQERWIIENSSFLSLSFSHGPQGFSEGYSTEEINYSESINETENNFSISIKNIEKK